MKIVRDRSAYMPASSLNSLKSRWQQRTPYTKTCTKVWKPSQNVGKPFAHVFFLYAVGLTIINRGATSYHTYYSKEGRRKKKKNDAGLQFFCCRSKKSSRSLSPPQSRSITYHKKPARKETVRVIMLQTAGNEMDARRLVFLASIFLTNQNQNIFQH